MAMTVVLDGKYTFQSEPTAGAYWRLVDLGGWYSSAQISAQFDAMPLSDGAFAPAQVFRGSKALSLEGVTMGHTAADAITNAWGVLAALSPNGLSMVLQVTDEVDTKRMQVWLAGAPQIIPFAPGRAKFQVPLVATDPRKYADRGRSTFIAPRGAATDGLRFPLGDKTTGYLNFGTFSASGLTSVTNRGTADTYPSFQVQGDIDGAGFTIISGEDAITYKGAIGGGASVTLSPYAGGRAVNNAGQDVSPYLTSSEWPVLKPGQSRTIQFLAFGQADANAGMTVTVSDAYW